MNRPWKTNGDQGITAGKDVDDEDEDFLKLSLGNGKKAVDHPPPPPRQSSRRWSPEFLQSSWRWSPELHDASSPSFGMASRSPHAVVSPPPFIVNPGAQRPPSNRPVIGNPTTAPPPPPTHDPVAGVVRPRTRRNPNQAPRAGKEETVEPVYPWAKNTRAKVHTFEYLVKESTKKIWGELQCKRCERTETKEYDLEERFLEIGKYIMTNKDKMRNRAPPEWMNPTFEDCVSCKQKNAMKPVMAEKKRNINWLFMLLGNTLGCCTLEQLKYFCKHTKQHRTGAKDRVLYYTYLGICKQLDPNGPFNP